MCGSQALTSALEATTAQDLGEGLGGVCGGVRWPGMSQNPSKDFELWFIRADGCFGTRNALKGCGTNDQDLRGLVRGVELWLWDDPGVERL